MTPCKLRIMIVNEKHKEAYRKFTMTFLMLTFFSLTVFSQVTKKQLDKFYKNNQTKKLEQVFIDLDNQNKDEFSKLSDNDTLKKTNDIFNVILPGRQKSEIVDYFFLQSNFPKTFIGDKELKYTGNYLASITIENLRPILYDYQTISEILKFIGPNPCDNKIVKEYFNDKGEMKKSKLGEAERLIADYDDKTKFVGQFLFLPATWGKMDRSLVPYIMNSLKFNSDLTEVEVTYDLTSSGATEIYRLLDGEWEKERTIISWID
jgi:hypothetical protein